MDMTPLSFALAHSLPEIVLAIGALVLLMMGALRRPKGDWIISECAIALLGLAALSMLFQVGPTAIIWDGAFIDDAFARFMKFLALGGAMVSLILSREFMAREQIDFFEFPTITDGVPHAALGPVDGLVISKDTKDLDNAEKLLTFMVGDPDVQAKWANIQGALSANLKVDPAKYTVVMQHALDVVKHADTFAFNYDLATPPPVAEVGLSMFSQFMNNPADYQAMLKQTESGAEEAAKQWKTGETGLQPRGAISAAHRSRRRDGRWRDKRGSGRRRSWPCRCSSSACSSCGRSQARFITASPTGTASTPIIVSSGSTISRASSPTGSSPTPSSTRSSGWLRR
ncbi:MAG: hypothetical protein J0H32_13930 [Rhizobiales bacterium]|nr:hypothetical protein [Hyphomicrobiales bacterium]